MNLFDIVGPVMIGQFTYSGGGAHRLCRAEAPRGGTDTDRDAATRVVCIDR